MLIVTSVFCAVLTFIFMRLSFQVVSIRKRTQLWLRPDGNEELERAIRAQTSFITYVPIGVVMVACLELNGAPWYLLVFMAMFLVIGRVLYIAGVTDPSGNEKKRNLGIAFTFAALLCLGVLNIIWPLYLMS
jgi:uncharacterized protein